MSQGELWASMMVAAQNGDGPTYNRLLREISPYLTSYLRYKLRSDTDAQDVLQDILISVHRSRHTFDGRSPFKPWLIAIAQCRLVDFWRRGSRRIEVLDFSDEDSCAEMVAEAEVSNIEIRDLQAVLARLTDQQRSIVTALKIDGKSIREIAKEFLMSESAVKVAAHRAYKFMAAELGMEL
jgi:RNA polymerase sigma-70 factor (ECF subfamily)